MSKLFTPIQVGDVTVAHRVVLAPLTRFKADIDHVPLPLVKEHYVQRASTPGTFLITEGVFIAPKAGGYNHVSGIWSRDQIVAWKEIVDGVHASQGVIFMQLWALGRAAEPPVLEKDGFDLHGPSPIPILKKSEFTAQDKHGVIPREMTVEEIEEYVQWYATAASNAICDANFDGVEILCSSGYLIDQFLQDVSNVRTDQYGGSIPNRARFALEVVDTVINVVGASKVGIRLSPWNPFQGPSQVLLPRRCPNGNILVLDMGMKYPIEQFAYVVTEVKKRHPNLAYLHMIEPRVYGPNDRKIGQGESNDVFRKIWEPKAFISAGGFTRKDAFELTEHSDNALVAFGRYFTSNPDMVRRLKENIELTPYDRSTFYLVGDSSGRGYTDFDFAA